MFNYLTCFYKCTIYMLIKKQKTKKKIKKKNFFMINRYVGPLDSEDAIIDMKFENLYFEGNHASGSGGGLYIDNIKPNSYDIFRSFILTNLTFINNSADECGGM